MIGNFNDIDPLTYEGAGNCIPINKISIRNKLGTGGTCEDCSVRIWQSSLQSNYNLRQSDFCGTIVGMSHF
jgi:hypothetical protein